MRSPKSFAGCKVMHFRLSKLFAVNDGLAFSKADTVFACPQACQAVNIHCKHLRSKLSKRPTKEETTQRQRDMTGRISSIKSYVQQVH